MKRICLIAVLGVFIWAGNINAQVRGTGAKFDPKAYGKAELADLDGLGFATEVPSSYSLKKYAPYPKDQGQTGTCVGWASAYAGLTIANAKKLGITDRNKITATAFCPYYTYLQVKVGDDYTCQLGTHIYNAMTSFRNTGSKKFYLPYYECGAKIDEATVTDAKNYRIKSFKKLFEYPAGQEWTYENFYNWKIDKATPVKQAVGNGYPVVMGMELPESIFYVVGSDQWKATEAEVAAIPNVKTYGHAMTIIGYDDNKYGGAFEVQNSWGTEWGNQGYFWVTYEDFNRFATDAFYFELFDNTNFTKAGCVMGDCNNGYGRYKFDTGDEYEGDFKNGYYDGYGIYIWANGAVYAGQWQNGKRHGVSTSVGSDGIAYTSNWKDDVLVYQDMKDDSETKLGCVSGNCENGYGTYNYNNGTYAGSFTNWKRNGHGVYSYNDGVKVSCTWKDDQMDGFGKITWPEGWYFVGEFLSNFQHGYGLEYGYGAFAPGYWFFGAYEEIDGGGLGYADGSASKGGESGRSVNLKAKGTKAQGNPSTGCISGNCINGFGVYSYNPGETYEGYFKDGYREGYGVYTWADGGKHSGTWIRDKQDGIGRIDFSDGAYFIGEFRKGLQDGYGIEIGSNQYVAGIWEFGKYKPGQSSLGFAGIDEKKTDLVLAQLGVGPKVAGMLKEVAGLQTKSPK